MKKNTSNPLHVATVKEKQNTQEFTCALTRIISISINGGEKNGDFNNIIHVIT